MSEVTRYNFELYHCNGGEMEVSPDGDFVDYDDYAALEKERDAECENWQRQCADMQKNLDAVLAENVMLKGFGNKLNDMHNNLNGEGTGIQGRAEVACQQVALGAAMEEFDAIKTPATDAMLSALRAEGIEILTGKLQQLIDEGVFDAKEIGVAAGAVHEGAQIAAQLRSETDTTPSQYESLAGGK